MIVALNRYITLTLVYFSLIHGEYFVEDAFPNLSFTDPVGIYDAGDGSDRLFVLEQPNFE